MQKIKKLKKEEFLEIELFQAKEEVLKKEREILTLKKQLFQSRQSTLKYVIKELDDNCLDMDNELKSLVSKVDQQKKAKDRLFIKIRKRLKLSGRFGYCENTLEIRE